MPSNTSIYLDKCMSWLFDWHWRPNFGLIYVHCISILAKETVTKNNGKKKGWMLSIWMLITNINTTPENIQNKRYARSLGKKSMEEKIQKRKTPRKPKKKREQSPDKRVAWEILSKPLVFVWFSQGFCWLTRIRRQESCVPKTSWNHELCPTPWVITTAQKLHARIYRTTFKKNNLSKSHLQISGQNCHYNTIRQGLI